MVDLYLGLLKIASRVISLLRMDGPFSNLRTFLTGKRADCGSGFFEIGLKNCERSLGFSSGLRLIFGAARGKDYLLCYCFEIELTLSSLSMLDCRLFMFFKKMTSPGRFGCMLKFELTLLCLPYLEMSERLFLVKREETESAFCSGGGAIYSFFRYANIGDLKHSFELL